MLEHKSSVPNRGHCIFVFKIIVFHRTGEFWFDDKCTTIFQFSRVIGKLGQITATVAEVSPDAVVVTVNTVFPAPGSPDFRGREPDCLNPTDLVFAASWKLNHINFGQWLNDVMIRLSYEKFFLFGKNSIFSSSDIGKNVDYMLKYISCSSFIVILSV